jgi:cytidine deaminase
VVILRSMNADQSVSQLLRAAALARKNAHAPYSGFKVGAAVLAGGRVYAACNVENSAFPLSVCAERNAVAMAVAAGHSRIDAVAVVGGATRPAAPCGGCRQVLAEFCGPDVPVAYATPHGARAMATMAELLPASFGRADLTERKAAQPSRRAPARRRRKV